jgi:hypothetical protein
MQGGTLGISNYSGTYTTYFYLQGNYTQTGGTLAGGLGTATGVKTFYFTAGPARTFSRTAGTINTDYINFYVYAGADLNMASNLTLTGASRSFSNNGTLRMGTNIIDGVASSSFTNANGVWATLYTANAQGIALAADGAIGSIQTGIRSYGTLANYVYNGSVAQITGSGLIGATDLTIDNAAGVNQANQAGVSASVTLTGTLYLTDGDYQIGGTAGNLNLLSLNGPAISGTGTNLKSTQYSNLTFGGAAANTNPGLYIPSSIADLNALTMNVNGTNTVTMNSDISLYAASNALILTSTHGGLLLLGAHDLNVTSTAVAAINGTPSITSMVVADGAGQLIRAIPGGLTGNNYYSFPVGDMSGTGIDNNTGADYFTSNTEFYKYRCKSGHQKYWYQGYRC